MKNIYLISNSYKSFYLFRKDIIKELSKKYNVFLIANDDEYSKYFNRFSTCIHLKKLFNEKSIFSNLKIIFILINNFLKNKPHLVQTYTHSKFNLYTNRKVIWIFYCFNDNWYGINFDY